MEEEAITALLRSSPLLLCVDLLAVELRAVESSTRILRAPNNTGWTHRRQASSTHRRPVAPARSDLRDCATPDPPRPAIASALGRPELEGASSVKAWASSAGFERRGRRWKKGVSWASSAARGAPSCSTSRPTGDPSCAVARVMRAVRLCRMPVEQGTPRDPKAVDGSRGYGWEGRRGMGGDVAERTSEQSAP
jgi:hypothetical protein